MAGLMLVFIAALVLYAAQKALAKSDGKMLCKSCGHIGKPVQKRGGSMALTVFLVFITLGTALLYYLFRSSNKTQVCEHCGSVELIRPDSPIGRQIIRSLSPVETK